MMLPRLEIAVNDAVLVRGVERHRNLPGDGDGLGECQAVLTIRPRQVVGERLPLDELHRQRLQAARLLEPEQGGDVGVAQRRQRSCLALEARPAHLVELRGVRQDLERRLS
jgi:hypothetical protein